MRSWLISGTSGTQSLSNQLGALMVAMGLVVCLCLAQVAFSMSLDASLQSLIIRARSLTGQVQTSLERDVTAATTAAATRFTQFDPAFAYLIILGGDSQALLDYPPTPQVRPPASVLERPARNDVSLQAFTMMDHAVFHATARVLDPSGNLRATVHLGLLQDSAFADASNVRLRVALVGAILFLIFGGWGWIRTARIQIWLDSLAGSIERTAFQGQLDPLPGVSSAINDKTGGLATPTQLEFTARLELMAQSGAPSNPIARLSRSYLALLSLLHRMISQVHALSRDDLDDPVLNQALPGHLGASVSQLLDNLRGLTVQVQAIARGELSMPMLEGVTEGDLGAAFSRMLGTLRTMANQAKAIARGDLEAEVLRDDLAGELGDAFAKMLMSLREMLGQMSLSASRLTLASEQVGGLCNKQVEGASQQSAAVSETSASVEELDATASQIADSAHQVQIVAQESLSSAEAGRKSMEEVANGIQDVRTFSHQSTKLIEELGLRSQKIGEVLEIINEIAGQTKLLSLNAAIEAARAGEAGRGFAIVAVEVRKLADNVVRSTHEIEKLISDIRGMVTNVVRTATEGQHRIETTVSRAQKAFESLQEILGAARRTADLAQQISVSTHQQKAGSEQIVSVMRDMVFVCAQTADTARQTSQAVADFSHLAQAMNHLVERYVTERRPQSVLSALDELSRH